MIFNDGKNMFQNYLLLYKMTLLLLWDKTENVTTYGEITNGLVVRAGISVT